MRHLLSLKDLTNDELRSIVKLAWDMKKTPEKFVESAKNKTLIMIFQKTSTRTRVSFEMAMTQLGGHGIFVDRQTANFDIADLGDEIRSIGHCDLILARLVYHDDAEKMARTSFVPILNGLTEKFHPSQLIGDLLTIQEQFGRIEGIRVLFVGIKNNMLNSLVLASHKMGVDLSIIAPEIHSVADDLEVNEIIRSHRMQKEPQKLTEELERADIVYTDTWVDIEFFTKESFKREKERRIESLGRLQITGDLLRQTGCLLLNPQPIHRGYEVDDAAVDQYGALVIKQAHNRLHSAKVIIDFYLRNRGNERP